MTAPIPQQFIVYLALFASLLLSPMSARAAEESDLGADCYAPTKPLAAELRTAFVAEIRPLAAKAERDHGIPAAIFAALALHESGYGTTRLAIATNNLLSYKWPGPPAGPDGRALYDLTCQPREDEGRVYVVFRDHADAADFVAGRLAASPYYKPATTKYHADLGAGTDAREAVIGWSKTIAPTYNPYHTDNYVRVVLASADDPLMNSAHLNPATTLWTLAAAQPRAVALAQAGGTAAPTAGGADDPERAALASVIAQDFRTSRYMMSDSDCKPAAEDPELAANTVVRPYLEAVAANPGSGARVVACTYVYRETPSGPQRQGFGVLLDLPPALIAGWITSACRAASPTNVHACGLALIAHMIDQNGGQYSITGFVAEGGPNDGLCVQRGRDAKKQGLIGFRYGVTVQFDESAGGGAPPILYCTTDPIPIEVQQRVALMQPQTTSFHVGRVAGLRDSCWTSHVPMTPAQGLAPAPWQQIVHESMLTALKGGTEALFDRAAWLRANPLRRPPGCE